MHHKFAAQDPTLEFIKSGQVLSARNTAGQFTQAGGSTPQTSNLSSSSGSPPATPQAKTPKKTRTRGGTAAVISSMKL